MPWLWPPPPWRSPCASPSTTFCRRLSLPYFFPAVILTTFFFGLRPGITCATLSGLAARYFFIPPVPSFLINGPTALA